MDDSKSELRCLIAKLNAGDDSAAETLVERYRSWLLMLARVQIDARYQGKFDASDIVQQTMFEAVRDISQFRGDSAGELAAWLRTILSHTLGHEFRRYGGTEKRDVSREVSIEQSLTQSSMNLRAVLAGNDTGPIDRAIRDEQEVVLAEVLERLPDDYRTVIMLRNIEGYSHEEVAQRMDRQVGAVRMLWVRALARLKKELDVSGRFG